ncbi:MAG: hypothetical protein LC748_00005, partial [Thermomicrobia bacterium]|nr:hypothetical protein [Thermomicrobia bacterium]
GSDYVTIMDVEPHWHRMRAIIRCNMPVILHLTDDDLEREIVHELCHCLICEMRAWTPDHREHEERVVAHLTKAIISTEVRGWNDGKADVRRKQKAEQAKDGKP